MADDGLNEQLHEVAAFFAGRIKGDRDVLLAHKLDRSRLDLSVESLRAVDSWLGSLREANVSSGSEGAAESIIWAGAYVGEVVRRCVKRQYTWKRYEDHMAGLSSDMRSMLPYTFGTQFLLQSDQGITLPINKVVRFLEEGPENSVHFYARSECGGG